MKPVGALTREEVLAVVRRHGIIYKVRKLKYSSIISKIMKVETRAFSADGYAVVTAKPEQTIILRRWFIEKPPIGYLFDNYFHALAYSLKVKANLKEKDNA